MKHDDSDKTGGVRDLGHSCAGVGNGDNSGNDRGSVQTVFSTPHTSSQASPPPHEALSALLAVLNAWVKPLLNFHVDVSLLSFHDQRLNDGVE